MSIAGTGGSIDLAPQYAKYENGTVKAVFATGLITLNTQPIAGDTVVVGADTYTFQTVLAVAFDVKIGTTVAASADNLRRAIKAAGVAGVNYFTAVDNAAVTADNAAGNVYITAATAGSAGNSIVLTKTSSHITVSGAGTLTGGVTSAAFDPTLLTYTKFPATVIDYDSVQNQAPLPQEIRPGIVPTGAYKSGVTLTGGATTIPRLAGNIGNQLLALMGSAVTVVDSPVAGANTHTFSYRQDNELPWVTVRKMIPGRGPIRNKGLIGYDNKVASMRLTLPQSGPVAARLDFQGRVPVMDNHPDAWINGTWENADTIALACKGNFGLPSQANLPTNLQVTQVILEFNNGLSTMQQEQIIGSYFADDFIALTRSLSIRFVYKWYDPLLEELVFAGASLGTVWTPTPFITTWDGGSNYAFQASVQSPNNIGVTNTPDSLTVRARKVFWMPVNNMSLQGGALIAQEYMGIALAPDVQTDSYADIILVNGNSAGYTIPAAP